MGKRFTDTDKWRDPWFRRLPPHGKLFWLYVLDECDKAGFWKVDFELASYFIGAVITEEDAAGWLECRFTRFNGELWWIPKFIEFQYGTLCSDCRPHRVVIEALRKKGVSIPYANTMDTNKKRTRQRKEQDKKKTREDTGFTVFWEAYPRKVNPEVARREWKKRDYAQELEAILAALKWQRELPEWREPRFIPHPATYLKDRRWEDEQPSRPKQTTAKDRARQRMEKTLQDYADRLRVIREWAASGTPPYDTAEAEADLKAKAEDALPAGSWRRIQQLAKQKGAA